MRRFVPLAAAAAVVASSTLAFAAAQTSEGTIKSYSMAGHEFSLQDGTVFNLPKTFQDPGVKAGAKVKVTWDMQNGSRMASAVTIEQ